MSPKHKLGEIIFDLAERVDYVNFRHTPSVLSQNTYTLRIIKKVGNEVRSIEEVITDQLLNQIDDVDTVVDAIIEKINRRAVR